MEKYRVSVKDLVSFNNLNGGLGGAILNSNRALIGIKEHQKIQNSRTSDYLKEYSLKTTEERDGFVVEVFGRADGIYPNSSPPIIEEIKTTTSENTDDNHISQVKLYAYIYLIENSLKDIFFESIDIKLIYININNNNIRTIDLSFTEIELKNFFNELITPYFDYLISNREWNLNRNESIKNLQFPFKNYRNGQRVFSVNVFRAIRDSKTLFAEAPTGTGKSVATIFPALKAMGEGYSSKIFYLTAKTVGRLIARDTVNLLRESGVKLRSVIISAKEKICINDEFNCSQDRCEYAMGYYEKLSGNIDSFLKESDFHEANLKDYGYRCKICPFELSLDISNYCDIIICDYNYVFDLRVYLKRYFDGGVKDYTLLIDEAHNLPERLRNSYSVSITREDIPPLFTIVNEVSSETLIHLESLNTLLLGYVNISEKDIIEDKVPGELVTIIRNLTLSIERFMLEIDYRGKNLILDLYFNMLFFIKLSELFTEGHRFLITHNGGLGITIEIVCLDPSSIFTKMLLKSKSHIFFSGTLNPINYYIDTLLKQSDNESIHIPSPFNTKNLEIIIRDDIKTTYKERSKSYFQISEIIKNVVGRKSGNYIVYFPSYSYLEEVLRFFDDGVVIQRQSMKEDERELFLEKFTEKSNVLSFAITGGIFGEGIDLIGDKLIGVIVIGTGLPGISTKNDLIKSIYNYDYAYTFPGFNKVQQAVGRVIRDENDRGIALLIDHRYRGSLYKRLFPLHWSNIIFCSNDGDMEKSMDKFWSA